MIWIFALFTGIVFSLPILWWVIFVVLVIAFDRDMFK